MTGGDPEAAFVETRMIYCPIIGEINEARGYDLEKLLPGSEVQGPGIIWTPITNIVVNPGHRATLDQHRNVLLTS
jgi:N-methylhydantoinase A/oxoprolinase/acetone carboxylase beta subunit